MSDFGDKAKSELRGAGKDLGKEAGRLIIAAFMGWVKTRPLKRLIQRRRRQKEEDGRD